MLTEAQNRELTQVGAGTPMGDYLRRYWHPVAGTGEFTRRQTKPVRLMGEDLVLFRTRRGDYGLVDRHCAHRRADLSYGIVEEDGLRCNYHGWCFDRSGACIHQPFDDIARGRNRKRGNSGLRAYPVQVKAGMVWAYLGPDPAPLIPDWEPFSWENCFVQVVLSEIPCNWLQCQENSIDPLHFEWMHDNWSRRLNGDADSVGPTHLKIHFEEFEYGFTYHRIREDTDEAHDLWMVGRSFLWPNCFYPGGHFEYRVPIDDENTLSVLWKCVRVPHECEPYLQKEVPAWHGPVEDERGNWITSHVMNQDFLAWVGQGRIADRTREKLTLGDRGIVMVRQCFFDDMKRVQAGAEPKGTIRDPERNRSIPLPTVDHDHFLRGRSRAEMLADPFTRRSMEEFILQAGQPEEVRDMFRAAMGITERDLASSPLATALRTS